MNCDAVILIGPPASGKGKISEALAKRNNFFRIVTSHLIEEEAIRNKVFAQRSKELISAGRLLSDREINRLIAERLEFAPWGDHVVIDGSCRSVEQAMMLRQRLLREHFIPIIVSLEATFETCFSRMKMRQELEGRVDDEENVFRRRYETFKKSADVVKKYFSIYTVVHEVNANRDFEVVYAEVLTHCHPQVTIRR